MQQGPPKGKVSLCFVQNNIFLVLLMQHVSSTFTRRDRLTLNYARLNNLMFEFSWSSQQGVNAQKIFIFSAFKTSIIAPIGPQVLR